MLKDFRIRAVSSCVRELKNLFLLKHSIDIETQSWFCTENSCNYILPGYFQYCKDKSLRGWDQGIQYEPTIIAGRYLYFPIEYRVSSNLYCILKNMHSLEGVDSIIKILQKLDQSWLRSETELFFALSKKCIQKNLLEIFKEII